MARIIIHDAKGPMEIKVGDQKKLICACGLSKDKPFCDGSHAETMDEDDGKTYQYHEDGTREEVE